MPRIVLTLVLGLLAAVPGAARAGLLVAPTRLVFEGGQRSGELAVVNQGQRPERYRISLVQRRMGDDGHLRAVERGELGPEEPPADALLRFSPRQMLLQPGEAQTVRILVRKPGDLARGEYRSHLLIQQIPETPTPAALDASGFSVHIQPIYGVTLPLIVRHGQLAAKASIQDLSLSLDESRRPVLRLRLSRLGDRSLFGHARVLHYPPVGAPRVVAQVNGLSVYPPLASRQVDLRLDFPEGTLPRGGRLWLEYREPDETKGAQLAEATLELSPAPPR